MAMDPMVADYLAIVEGMLSLQACDFKRAHHVLSKANGSSSFLHFLAKVLVEYSVAKVVS